jgi:serine/threonine protein phosphatase PrpC
VPSEQKRIAAAGGFVDMEGTPPRVGGELEVSRAFGDFHLKGITCEPAVCEVALTEDQDILIVASDGLWDKVSPDTAVSILARLEKHSAYSWLLLHCTDTNIALICCTGANEITQDLQLYCAWCRSSARGRC